MDPTMAILQSAIGTPTGAAPAADPTMAILQSAGQYTPPPPIPTPGNLPVNYPAWARTQDSGFNVGELNGGAMANALEGPTLGLYDEENAGLASLHHNLWPLLTGKPTNFKGDYNDVLTPTRNAIKNYSINHPYMAIASQVAASIPTMGAGGVKAIAENPSLPTAMARGAMTGGMFGGIGGFGSGEGGFGNRAAGAATGAELGTALGAASVPVVGTVSATARKLGSVLMDNAGNSAESKAGNILMDNLSADKIAPADAVAQLRNDPTGQMTLADIGGENSSTARLGRALVTLPGDASKDITDFVTGRASGQADRLNDAISTHLADGQDLGQLQNTIMAGQKSAASPLYEAAYKANQSISSPKIDAILNTPAGRSAMKQASVLMQNDQSLMGVSDPDLLEQAREGGTEIPWKGGVASGLKLRSLDYVKRALDDQISTAFKAGNNTEGGIITGLKSKLVSALDDADVTAAAGPNSTKSEGGLYAQARAAWSGPAKSLDAIEAGKMFLKPGTDIEGDMANLSPSDQQLYKIGAAKVLQDKLASIGDNRNAATPMFGNPAIRQKIGTVFGEDAADKFGNAASRENTFQDTSNFLTGGSQTANKAAEILKPGRVQKIMGEALQGGTAGFMGGGLHGAAVGAVGLPLANYAGDVATGISQRNALSNPDTAAALGKLLIAAGPEGADKLESIISSAGATKNADAAYRAALAAHLMKNAPLAGITANAITMNRGQH